MSFVEKTPISGLLLLHPQIFEDNRGYFFESYNQQRAQKAGLQYQWLQENEAKSTYGVIRGLHYQAPPYAQAKLVRVVSGKVLDVVVDLRPQSATYGQSYQQILSGTNKIQMLVPRGFAHGYSVLSPSAIFSYKCDNYYHKPAEGGIHVNDPTLNINWQIPLADQNVSQKDQNLPNITEIQ